MRLSSDVHRRSGLVHAFGTALNNGAGGGTGKGGKGVAGRCKDTAGWSDDYGTCADYVKVRPNTLRDEPL